MLFVCVLYVQDEVSTSPDEPVTVQPGVPDAGGDEDDDSAEKQDERTNLSATGQRSYGADHPVLVSVSHAGDASNIDSK